MRLKDPDSGWHLLKTGVPTMAGLLLLYFAFPAQNVDSTPRLVFGVLATVAGVAIVGWVIARYIIGSARGSRSMMTPINLLLTVELVVIVFSFGYFILATEGTNQMVGLETRLDALYFTMTTLATVGFGDVHASGQLARGMVTVQIVFNLVFIGALVAVTKAHINAERERRKEAENAEPDST